MHPILLDLGEVSLGRLALPLRLGAYGTLLVLGIACGWMLAARLLRRWAPGTDSTILFGTMAVVGLAGGKLYNVVFHFDDLLSGRLPLGDLLRSGGSFLPGALLALGIGTVMMRRQGLAVGTFANALAPAASLGNAIARWGCLLAGCCHGRPTNRPWAITYHDALAHQLNGVPLGVSLHPSPVYESLLELGNVALLLYLAKKNPKPWSLFAVWAALYGAERFFLETLRTQHEILAGLTPNQWICLALVLAGASFLVLRPPVHRRLPA